MVLMDSNVTNALGQWVPFFSVTGAAAATLVGLVFVAVSINVRALDLEESADIRALARRTLGGFIFILLVSLLFLIPRVDPHALALSIGITSAVYIARIGRDARQRGREAIDRSVVLALVGYLLSLAVAYGIWRDEPRWLDLLPVILVATLATAAWNSWELLLQIGRVDPNRP